MTLKILIVEGNEASASASLQAHGMPPYAEGYQQVLTQLSDRPLDCDIIRPAQQGVDCLAAGKSFKDYDGIVWTGSSLSVLDADEPAVRAQVKLAKQAFASKTPIFGSCWGLQVMTVALGGEVRQSPNGREIGIGRQILLNDAGVAHPMFETKPRVFQSFTTHSDEVARLPEGAALLASNSHSEVQAATIERDGSLFWGTQYHPEFDWPLMAVIFRRRMAQLVEEGVFATEADGQQVAADFQQMETAANAQYWRYGVDANSMADDLRRSELAAWFKLVSD